MNTSKIQGMAGTMLCLGLMLVLAACGDSDGSSGSGSGGGQPLSVEGVVSDGPVIGGTLFVFAGSEIQAALDAAAGAEDRRAALMAAGPITSRSRDPSEEDQFALSIPAAHANSAVFILLDSEGAEDAAFRDTPPTLESVAVLGAAGGSQRVNISLHTTLMSQQVRSGLPLDSAGIEAALATAETNVLGALGADNLGEPFYPDSSPLREEDDDVVHAASGFIGMLVRSISILTGADPDTVVAALAGDAADGAIDGLIPGSMSSAPELTAIAEQAGAIRSAGSDDGIGMLAVGSCSTSAVSARRACGFDILDEQFEMLAKCADLVDEQARDECLDEAGEVAEEVGEECATVFEARLALCEATGDAAHEPSFGPDFAANFVDPADIGGAVMPNPYFPLVAGNTWVYEGDGESNTVTVTDRTKLIDGITCLVVTDIATEDGSVVEATEDWYAQDLAGNIWYCGEIARNFERFVGDDPQTPELTDVGGSWKHAREGAKAGILLPAIPEVGAVIRQEVLLGEAEDAIEILSIAATESSAGGSCTATCLQTHDFTPLEPEANEHKFYAPGIGLIVEIDQNTGDRVELVEFTAGT